MTVFTTIRKRIISLKRAMTIEHRYIAVFIAVFVIAGVTYLTLSSAATFVTSFEAENGVVAGNATKANDNNASGAGSVRFGDSGTAPNGAWSDANPPWKLGTGESVDDNRPAGVQVINYADYSNSNARSFGQTLAAIRTAAKAPYYVRMPAGSFRVTDFSFAAGTGVGRGYQDVNSTKYFGGIIGAGADKTFITVDPNIMTAAQLSGIASGESTSVSVIYAGGSALAIPTFFSGLTFRGNFQQSTTLNGVSGTAPAPYAGISLSSVKTGSVVQYCRFQGLGFAAKASPPYELGTISSTHSSWTFRRSEIDGRLAKEVNASQPVSAGGLMWNYETNVKTIDSWLHNTRRSGFAMHDHAPSEGGNANDPGIYYAENFQTQDIANTPDSYAGTNLGFPGSNVEELKQTFTYIRPRFTASSANKEHLHIGTSGTNSMAQAMVITDPIIGNTTYNGCLVIGVSKQPNSYGLSPYYSLYQSSGLSAFPITVTKNSVRLQPVLLSSFNASIHTPDKYYLINI